MRPDPRFMGQAGRPAPVKVRWRGSSYDLRAASLLAAQQQSFGNLEAAAEIYSLIAAKYPAAEIYNNLGALSQRLGRLEAAVSYYDRAIRLKPEYANAHFNRASALKQLNRIAEALAGYDRAIALNPNHAEAHNNRGVLLQGLNRFPEAVADYDRAIGLKPDYVEAHNNRGVALMALGRVSEAQAMFRRALEWQPNFSEALFNLANSHQFADAEMSEVQRLRDSLQRPNLPPEEQEQLLFALGKMHDDRGHYDEAFACFQKANQIRGARVKYNAAAVEQLTADLMTVFSREFLASPSVFASASQAPVFIVGMPRSGTTLLASILSNHPAVAMAGELPTLDELARQLPERIGKLAGKVGPYPQAMRQLSALVAAEMVAEYEQRLRRDVGPTVPFVIDKNPLNFRHVGLIRMLFPKAKIFHCTRHPWDTALSNYFQRFPLALDYCFDLGHIAHFEREYARLMAHWRSIPGLPMLEVSYEDLVSHTEATARKALDFLGLAWEPRCLTPHLNPAPVQTASHWQVRQPIYGHALERWRHYDKYLAELKSALPLE